MTLTLDQTPTNLVERIVSKVRRTRRDWERNALRKRLLSLPPAPDNAPVQPFSLHTLLCKRDLEMGICSAKSLQMASGEKYKFVFHEDGSLSDRDIQKIKFHFPASTIIPRKLADAEINKTYKQYVHALKWRSWSPTAMKIIDVWHYASQSRIIFADPDVLFVRNPKHLLHAKQNVFNKDMESAYTISIEDMRKTWGVAVLPEVNSGLWSVSREGFNIQWMDEVLGSAEFEKLWESSKRKYVLEQTMMALMFSKEKDIQLLPKEYDVDYYKSLDTSICKHYVGRIRYGFETEGIRYLLDHMNFEARWMDLVRNSQ